MKNKTSKKLALLIGIMFLLNVLQVIYLQIKVDEATQQPLKPTAYATGATKLCFNQPPDNITTDCNFTIKWGYNYACSITGTDPNNDALTYNSTFITPTNLFNVTQSGNINFTANKSAIGNHTVRFYTYDNSGCENNMYTQDYNITIIEANHAPYMSTNLTNLTLLRDASYSFYLNDYFTDPDGDNMTYIVSSSNDSVASITLLNTSQVIIKGLTCGTSYVYYIATDPGGLSGTSNTLAYIITNCPAPPSSGGQGETGGGGGGGSGSIQQCKPDWECGAWSDCRNGTSIIECQDHHACDPLHYIEHHYRNCTYVPENYTCIEDWQCTPWSTCNADSKGVYTHQRQCLDHNSCGTQFTKLPETEACAPIASCFNGVKDGNETDIDCGGECGECKKVEIPGNVQQKISTGVLIASILTLIIIALIIYGLRKKISKLFITIAKSSKMKKKPIYLQEAQKEKLLQRIYLTQQRMEEGKYDAMRSEISSYIIEYFGYIFNIEKVQRLIINESMNKIKEKELQRIIIDFYDKLAISENDKKSKISVAAMQALIDEMLQNVYLISTFTEKDAITCVKERQYELNTGIDVCYLNLSNLYIALEFSQLTEAKNIYKQMMAKYDILGIEDKQKIYTDIIRAFNVIKYLEGYEIKHR